MGRLPDGFETAVENLKKRKREKGQRESDSRWPQSVEKPHVGRRCPQTALRLFAGEVLRHKV